MIFAVGLILGFIIGIILCIVIDTVYENRRMKKFYNERLNLLAELEQLKRSSDDAKKANL